MEFDNVLYVIGNGFDLHHGVMSSYASFSIWLKRKNIELYNKLSNVCKVDFLWKDFEQALAVVDRDYFLSIGEAWLPYGWTEDDSCAELFYAQDIVRGEAEELWKDIQKWFRKWVNSIKWYECYNKKKIYLDYNARYITFNYTPFLETQYGIDSKRILYLHGKRTDNKNLPLIGHDGRDTFDEWYTKKNNHYRRYYRGKNADLPEIDTMTNSAEEYFSLSEKPIEEIIRKNTKFFEDLYDVEYIYVLGHSFGNVDLPYFRLLNKVNDYPEKIKWIVSFYSEKERSNINKILQDKVVRKGATIEMITLDSMCMSI